MKKYLLPVIIIALFTGGCAKKTEIPETDVSALEAERAITRAQSEIDEAEELGADVTEPERILEEARDLLSRDNKEKAYQEANRARDMASELKAELLTEERKREDAKLAIEEAESLQKEARKTVTGEDLKKQLDEAADYLNRAKEDFDSNNYDEVIELANKSSKLFKSIISTSRGSDKDMYVVKTWEADRDCLWNIAAKSDIYDDPWKWKKIYNANKQKIKDPDLIYPGQEFAIPPK